MSVQETKFYNFEDELNLFDLRRFIGKPGFENLCEFKGYYNINKIIISKLVDNFRKDFVIAGEYIALSVYKEVSKILANQVIDIFVFGKEKFINIVEYIIKNFNSSLIAVLSKENTITFIHNSDQPRIQLVCVENKSYLDLLRTFDLSYNRIMIRYTGFLCNENSELLVTKSFLKSFRNNKIRIMKKGHTKTLERLVKYTLLFKTNNKVKTELLDQEKEKLEMDFYIPFKGITFRKFARDQKLLFPDHDNEFYDPKEINIDTLIEKFNDPKTHLESEPETEEETESEVNEESENSFEILNKS